MLAENQSSRSIQIEEKKVKEEEKNKENGVNLIEIPASSNSDQSETFPEEAKELQKLDFDWKKELQNNRLFSQDIPYSYDKLIENLLKINEKLDALHPLFFFLAVFEFTKALKALSSALKLAFSDITEKVDICRVIFKDFFPEFDNIQALMLEEIELDLHKLNGDNNSDLGHKKKTKFYEYQSMTRTVLRILRFLKYVWQMFRYIQTTQDKLCDIMVKTYDVVLAPHHGWILRKSAQLALKFAPDDRLPLFQGFFGIKNSFINFYFIVYLIID